MATAMTDRLARQASGETKLDFVRSDPAEPELRMVPLSVIDPDPHQPRKNKGDLTHLALSIQRDGLIQPIVVEPMPDGRYRILAGERRFAACRSLQWASMPAIIRTVKEHSRLAQQLIENIHRKDLNPIEEAEGLRRLMDEFNLSQNKAAARIGRSCAAVSQTLRLLDLPAQILKEARDEEPTNKSVLLEIAKEADPQRQTELWKQAKAGSLTVRNARTKASRPAKPQAAVTLKTIHLPGVIVRLEFESGDATNARVAEALRAALERLANAIEKPVEDGTCRSDSGADRRPGEDR